ncbi:glycosyltransferase family 4 protein [Variovorax sp. J31P207]|uniref:glycosyltransferase family 4 protein n=1 Tax=Variovorax sp. J31P207 TaxID=3053510 RepID=UPI002576315E|nr:glycosyltransferase family 4 protein [Variovorax sp. J31P207]MDM0065645.1 glycosyltransferase family 4 protein [Variovorax sp. J31P207]
MSKDVISDRYARLYEMPRQLALHGHDVLGLCLAYRPQTAGRWIHEAAPGQLQWSARSLGRMPLPGLLAYPWQVLDELRGFAPDVLIGASDIPHAALTAWLARRLKVPYAIDLYDNFEGFGQARIPGFVPALRSATRHAALVTTTSTPLREFVLEEYAVQGEVLALESTVDRAVFRPREQLTCRRALGLPEHARLIGTAGGLYRDKGVLPLYDAWRLLSERMPNVHLVLAGPQDPELPAPKGPRVHDLGQLEHARVAELFCALDVGVISILDTAFGRFCFPQKAYEMLACGLPVAAADVGAMSTLFAATPQALFESGHAEQLTRAIERQLLAPVRPRIEIEDWSQLIGRMESRLQHIVQPGAALRSRAA